MKLIKADYFVIVAIILFLGCHLATNFLINYYREVADTLKVSQELAYMTEANPIAKYILQIKGFNLIYSYIMMPGILGGIYYVIRKKYSSNPENVMVFAVTLLLLGVFNFLNDITVLLGVIM